MMELSCEADCANERPFDIETRSARFRSMPKKQLTIVIPAYNEENRLPPNIRKALEWADKTSVFEIEFIIVDDGSEDRTCDLVREFTSKDSRVRLIEETHVGAVHAILAGFRAAKYPLVGYM
ncbi:uncharacterized protein METZ01_LOCUS366970, partial [marine metagenome]